MARKAVIVSYRYRGNPKKRRKCRNAFHHQIFPLTNPNFPFGIPSLLFLQHKFRYSTATALSPIFFIYFLFFTKLGFINQGVSPSYIFSNIWVFKICKFPISISRVIFRFNCRVGGGFPITKKKKRGEQEAEDC